MERMPHETLTEIFGFLDPIELFVVAMVCKAWNRISSEEKIWMKWKSDLKSQYFQWLKEQTATFASGKTLDWMHSQRVKEPGEEHDYLVKLVLAGTCGVGKSCIFLRYTDDTFSDQYIPTNGVEFKSKKVIFYPKIVQLQIWDISGHERFSTISSTYYRRAHGVMLVYDVNSRYSFERLNYFFNVVRAQAHENVVKFLVGNKQDDSSNRAVGVDEAKELAISHGYHYFEVSAKTGENITEVFMDMVKEILPGPIPPSADLFLERIKTTQTTPRTHTQSNKNKKEKCIVS